MALSISIPFDRLQRGGAWARMRHPRHGNARRRFDNAVPRDSTAPLLAGKRALDILGSALGLLIFAPLLIGIAAAIKITSPGPIFFRQKRYGYHNRRFLIFKFRTMYVERGDQRGVQQTTAGDSRVTPLGRILRKTSLDELPQLINVLRGDMSLVGPRPHVPGMLANGMLYEAMIPYYFQRHNMRPGLTGLAQVRGFRGSTADPAAALARLDCDLEYIESWSLRRDIAIIVRTAVKEFLSGSGG